MGRIILLLISHIFLWKTTDEILDLIYQQCDMAMKILVLLSYYYAYSFLEISLDFFVLSLLLLVLFLTRFHSGLY